LEFPFSRDCRAGLSDAAATRLRRMCTKSRYAKSILSPRWGWSASHFCPRLAPWAAFLRRFGGCGIMFLFCRVVEILVLAYTLEALRTPNANRSAWLLDAWPGSSSLAWGLRREQFACVRLSRICCYPIDNVSVYRLSGWEFGVNGKVSGCGLPDCQLEEHRGRWLRGRDQADGDGRSAGAADDGGYADVS
jgi:hypothetical protein